MFTLNCKGRLLVTKTPLVMGIINATPDSFLASSRQQHINGALQVAGQMLEAGARILDIGGQSTRPGSQAIAADEELQRVIDIVDAIHRRFPESFISIDTYHGKVAKEAVAAGAHIVNDISAGSMDDTLLPMVASLGVPYVLMHMQGTPDRMQELPQYESIGRELLDFFIARKEALRRLGIQDVIIDPGFGFGKTIAHNFRLLQQLPVFQLLDCPIMVGLSRKSTIYRTLGITAEEALNGTTVLNTIALLNGASLLRVHDVKEAVEAVKLVGKMKEYI